MMKSQKLLLSFGVIMEAVILPGMEIEYHVKRNGKIIANIFEGQIRLFKANCPAKILAYVYEVIKGLVQNDFNQIVELERSSLK